MAGQGKNAQRLRRPVQRLYPLEISVLEDQPTDPSTSVPQSPDNTEPNPLMRHSGQAAARMARDQIMAQALESTDDGEC